MAHTKEKDWRNDGRADQRKAAVTPREIEEGSQEKKMDRWGIRIV